MSLACISFLSPRLQAVLEDVCSSFMTLVQHLKTHFSEITDAITRGHWTCDVHRKQKAVVHAASVLKHTIER